MPKYLSSLRKCFCATPTHKDGKTINWLRLVKTVFLILTYISWGMANSIAYAAIPDLRVRLNTTVEGMSYAFSLGVLGSVVATPLGICADRMGSYSGLILGLCLCVTALSNMLKPYTTTVWYYAICEFADITGWVLMGNVSNSLLLLMWGVDGTSPLHAMHLGYPIGAAIGGQIAKAFVSRNYTETELSKTIQNVLRHNSSEYVITNKSQIDLQHDQVGFMDDSRIEIGFLIIASFALFLGILLIIFQFVGKKETRQKANKRSYRWREIWHPSSWGVADAKFALTLFALYVLLQIALAGCDKGLAQYLAAYSVDSNLRFSNQEAATLISTYYFLDGVGLFVCIFIAKYMSLKYMLLIEVHAMTLIAIGLMIFGESSKTSLYILSAMFSLFKGPAWAAIYAWPDFYITLLSTILAAAHVIRSILDVFMTAFQGYLYTNTTIESIFYTAFGYGLFLCVLMYMVCYITWKRPGRHVETKQVASKESSKSPSNQPDTQVALL